MSSDNTSGPSDAPPLRAQVRRLLVDVLPLAVDFDAFASDYFPKEYPRLSGAADLKERHTLLLALVEPDKLLAALRSAYPDRIDKIEKAAESEEPLLRQRERELTEKLTRLLKLRDEIGEWTTGANTTRLDTEIQIAEKALRHGPSLRVGEVLNRSYQLLLSLGTGTFAEVWQAKALGDINEKAVAIKVLHGQWSKDRTLVTRFATGAKQQKELDHPHIVRVLSLAAEYQGFHYFVMEYLPGGDLYQAVLKDSSGARRNEWIRAVLDIGSALSSAHERFGTLVHRDVKPHNILLDADGQAKLCDFDLVVDQRAVRMTRTSQGLGTPDFAAPEQQRNAAHVDQRADVYGLARTLMFVLLGRSMLDHDEGPTQLLERVPGSPALREVLRRATQRDPNARYKSVAAFCAGVEEALAAPLEAALSQPEVAAPAISGPPAASPPRSTEELFANEQRAAPATQPPAVVPPPSAGSSASENSSSGPALDTKPQEPTDSGGRVVGAEPPSTSPAHPPVVAGLLPPHPATPADGNEAQKSARIPPAPDKPSPPPITQSPSLVRRRLLPWLAVGALLVPLGFGARTLLQGGGMPPGNKRQPSDLGSIPAPLVAADLREADKAADLSPPSLGRPDLGTGKDLAAVVPEPPTAPPPPAPKIPGMVWLPGGAFDMGSNTGDADEKPMHKVEVASFYLDRTEVTAEAYARCVSAGNCTKQDTVDWAGITDAERQRWNPTCTYGKAGKEKHPMNCVSWDQAKAYCAWAGKRLPTETEWEYAARGQAGRKYPWGTAAPGPSRLNACGSECVKYWKNFGVTGWTEMYAGSDGHEATAPVGSIAGDRTPEGILDLGGNVSEWMGNFYTDNYKPGGPTKSERAIRGASWAYYFATLARSAYRGGLAPASRNFELGFRCARTK